MYICFITKICLITTIGLFTRFNQYFIHHTKKTKVFCAKIANYKELSFCKKECEKCLKMIGILLFSGLN